MFYLRHRKWCPRQTSSQTGRSENEGFITISKQVVQERQYPHTEFPPFNSVVDLLPALILIIYQRFEKYKKMFNIYHFLSFTTVTYLTTYLFHWAQKCPGRTRIWTDR
jgi:hypothetical protein